MYICNSITAFKSRLSNSCDTTTNHNTLKSITTIECIITNPCNTIRDYDACKAGTATESIITNFCNALGYCHTLNLVIILEQFSTYRISFTLIVVREYKFRNNFVIYSIQTYIGNTSSVITIFRTSVLCIFDNHSICSIIGKQIFVTTRIYSTLFKNFFSINGYCQPIIIVLTAYIPIESQFIIFFRFYRISARRRTAVIGVC